MKARKPEKSLVVGLDVGTSKIVAIVGESQADGSVEVIGLGSHPSTGLRRGVVVDMASTEQAIQRAVEEAELMAGCEIHSVYAGISGSHIRSLNSDGTVAIKDKEVSEGDVDRVLDAARAVPVAADQKVLHVLPQEYVIDNQDGIRQPIGMAGVRLEAHVHVVTAALSATQNIGKCVARCGLTVDELIMQPLAASYAVLTDDEKDLGVCLVDIGAGTTDIAVFTDGAIRHTACISFAWRFGRQRSTRKISRSSMPVRWNNWRVTTKASRCPAWVTGRPATWPGKHWPRWSRRGTGSCSR